MEIQSLYPLLTEAIRRAEIYDEIKAPGARNAYRDVSLLEEQVARLLPASNDEGAIARRGAVRAAIAAEDLDRAEQLAEEYCADSNANASLKRELKDMVKQTSHQKAENPAFVARRYPRAFARYGGADLGRVIKEFLSQGAPLPIS
jgi:hypothetical protein